MIKYFCDCCEKDITLSQHCFVVTFKKIGNQPYERTYCEFCYYEAQKRVVLMKDELNKKEKATNEK